MKIRTPLALLALFILQPDSRADVLLVGPDRDFATIGAALEASAPGDTVLVAEGTYSEQLNLSEGIVIAAEPDSEVRLVSVDVNDLPEGRQVVLQGLSIGLEEFSGLGGGWVHVDDCAGPVSLQDLDVRATNCCQTTALAIANSSLVLVSGSRFEGSSEPTALFGDTDGWPGVEVRNSLVVLTTSELVGGDGAPSGGNGAPGVRVVQDAVVQLDGCDVTGGSAQQGSSSASAVTADSSGTCRVTGSSLEPGGNAPATSGPVTVIDDLARTLELASPAFAGTTATWGFVGGEGDLAFLAVSRRPLARFGLEGLAPGELLFLLPVGPLGEDGELRLELELPSFGGDALLTHHRFVGLTAEAQAFGGESRSLVVLGR